MGLEWDGWLCLARLREGSEEHQQLHHQQSSEEEAQACRSGHIHVQVELYQNYRYPMFLQHENLAWHIKFQEVGVSL